MGISYASCSRSFGCADSGNLDQEKRSNLSLRPSKSCPYAAGLGLSLQRRRPKHPNQTQQKSSLMECVSDACKAHCSPQIEKQSRPKWCMYFKEPNDSPAASTPSDATHRARPTCSAKQRGHPNKREPKHAWNALRVHRSAASTGVTCMMRARQNHDSDWFVLPTRNHKLYFLSFKPWEEMHST